MQALKFIKKVSKLVKKSFMNFFTKTLRTPKISGPVLTKHFITFIKNYMESMNVSR